MPWLPFWLSQEKHMNLTTDNDPAEMIYWHRELPPLTADVMGEHTIEANSARVPGTLAHRDELWDSCYRELMTQTRIRLEQEVERLGGHYAHVLGEVIDARHDEAKGEAWLQGRFMYMLYRRSGDGAHARGPE
jgi:hypothetical protein